MRRPSLPMRLSAVPVMLALVLTSAAPTAADHSAGHIAHSPAGWTGSIQTGWLGTTSEPRKDTVWSADLHYTLAGVNPASATVKWVYGEAHGPFSEVCPDQMITLSERELDPDGVSIHLDFHVAPADLDASGVADHYVPSGLGATWETAWESKDTCPDRDHSGFGERSLAMTIPGGYVPLPDGPWTTLTGSVSGDGFTASWELTSADSDGDGVVDGAETDIFNTRPDKRDTDDDGLDDGDEIWEHGTDPTKPDTDGDGLTDGDEVNLYDTDPTRSDSDGDGYLDGVEIDAGSDPNNPRSTPENPNPDDPDDPDDPDGPDTELIQVSHPVLFVHGIAGHPKSQNRKNCNDWNDMIDQFRRADGYPQRDGIEFTGKLVTLGYYYRDFNCSDYVDGHGSHETHHAGWVRPVICVRRCAFRPTHHDADRDGFEVLSHNLDTDIRHLAYHHAWYIWNNYSRPSEGAHLQRNVRIVAHSMGGLITRYLIAAVESDDPDFPPYLHIDRVVTLGTPHAGGQGLIANTCDRTLLWHQCDQMAPGSAFLEDLAGHAPQPHAEGGTNWTTIGSEFDDHVSDVSAVSMLAHLRVRYFASAEIEHEEYYRSPNDGYEADYAAEVSLFGGAWTTYAGLVRSVRLAELALADHASSALRD